MSRGIATVFRRKYGGIEELEQQKPNIGKALHLQRNGQHLFYLVTKERSHQKPTYEALKESLLNLRMELLRRGLTKLAIPRIGCGYDGLDWAVLRRMIQEIFADSGITVVVCVFNPWDSGMRTVTKDEFTNLRLPPGPVPGQNRLKEGVVSRSTERYGGERGRGAPPSPLLWKEGPSMSDWSAFPAGPVCLSSRTPPVCPPPHLPSFSPFKGSSSFSRFPQQPPRKF